ncbi:MAG: prolipoprotein diacylglyceryl transferase family protein [Candidatus Dormibacteria bacterium]
MNLNQVGPVHVSVNPVIFQAGPLQLNWLGLVVVLGLTLLVFQGMFEWPRWNGRREDFELVLLLALAAGLPLTVITEQVLAPIATRTLPAGFDPSLNSPLMYPLLLAAGGAIAVAGRRLGFSSWRMADVLALGAPVVLAASDAGCLATGCMAGVHTDTGLAVFYDNAASYAPQEQSLLALPLIHLAYLMLVFAVVALLSQSRFRPGSSTLAFLTLAAAGAAGVDTLRFDAAQPFWQVDALFAAAVAVSSAGLFLHHARPSWRPAPVVATRQALWPERPTFDWALLLARVPVIGRRSARRARRIAELDQRMAERTRPAPVLAVPATGAARRRLSLARHA